MPGAYTSSRANGIQLSFWLQLRFKWRRNDVQPNAPAILHARELRIRQHKMMFWLHLSVLDIFCTSFNEFRSILSLSTYYVNRYYGLFFLPFNHMISGIYESVLIISSWLLFRTLERTNSQTLPASLSEVDQVIHFRYSSDLVHVLFYGVWSNDLTPFIILGANRCLILGHSMQTNERHYSFSDQRRLNSIRSKLSSEQPA